MSKSNEQMQVEFHNRANTLFFSVYHAFENAVASLSRRKEEFKFQQLKKQYAETLQRDLQMVAKDILRIYKSERDVSETNQTLQGLISNYLHRFVQKVNDL
jgi:hypothetical protein